MAADNDREVGMLLDELLPQLFSVVKTVRMTRDAVVVRGSALTAAAVAIEAHVTLACHVGVRYKDYAAVRMLCNDFSCPANDIVARSKFQSHHKPLTPACLEEAVVVVEFLGLLVVNTAKRRLPLSVGHWKVFAQQGLSCRGIPAGT